MWRYQVYAFKKVTQAVSQLLPYLHDVKRRQVAQALLMSGRPHDIDLHRRADLTTHARLSLAWAAGFLEGDGCFSYSPSNNYACVSIPQTDRAILERFRTAVGFGKIYGPYRPHHTSDGRSPLFIYRAHGFANVQAIVAMLWAWLGPTKRRQAIQVLTVARARGITRCIRGHAKKPRQRACPECTRDHWDRARRGIGPQGRLFEEPLPYLARSG